MLITSKQYNILIILNITILFLIFCLLYIIYNDINVLQSKNYLDLSLDVALKDEKLQSEINKNTKEIIANQTNSYLILGLTFFVGLTFILFTNNVNLNTVHDSLTRSIGNCFQTETVLNKSNTKELIQKGGEGLTQLNTFTKNNLMEMETRIIDTLNTKIQNSGASSVVDMSVNTVLENPTLVSGAADILTNLGSTPPPII